MKIQNLTKLIIRFLGGGKIDFPTSNLREVEIEPLDINSDNEYSLDYIFDVVNVIKTINGVLEDIIVPIEDFNFSQYSGDEFEDKFYGNKDTAKYVIYKEANDTDDFYYLSENEKEIIDALLYEEQAKKFNPIDVDITWLKKQFPYYYILEAKTGTTLYFNYNYTTGNVYTDSVDNSSGGSGKTTRTLRNQAVACIFDAEYNINKIFIIKNGSITTQVRHYMSSSNVPPADSKVDKYLGVFSGYNFLEAGYIVESAIGFNIASITEQHSQIAK